MNGGTEMDVREKLVKLLSKYFDIGDSYAYNLTRVKSAFACGTMGFDDFEEFDEETVEDIASYLIKSGVTVQEWISVDDRLPEESGYYLVFEDIGRSEVLSYSKKYQAFNAYDDSYSESNVIPVTHWMPMPNPPKGE